jgi:glycosyltransferase involved in cell wall biosynthesis
MSATDHTSAVHRIAMIGSHLPRQCGIATFTASLAQAIADAQPATDCFVVAVNEVGHQHQYPPRVQFEISEPDLVSYRRAADFLNVNRVGVVSVQHEYGIFGGKAGSHLLTVLRDVRMPIVTTLHTLLEAPSARQRYVMDELVELSTRVVVMSADGVELLRQVHHVPRDKIDLIPHGVLAAPGGERKDQVGVAGKSVILTFGLLSPDKGIEHMIDALPAILREHPAVVYIVLGATHPHVRERAGESYRFALATRAARLGVDEAVIFYDRFVTEAELMDFLGAADIYVTPYLNMEQSTSGTLAYAVGMGRAVISTPYRHARELLAEGRGILVPRADSAAIAREVCGLLADDARRLALGARAAAFGPDRRWPAVAAAYLDTFARAQAEHQPRIRARTHEDPPLRLAPLPDLSLRHLALLTDGTGILQHARYNVPSYADGYCLDDNARALLLTALAEDAGTEHRDLVHTLMARYLAFVSYAFDPATHRFRNFMAYDRSWAPPAAGSDDCHGRAVWALGTVVGRASDPGRQSLAGWLFQAAVPAVLELPSPRAWAYALLGIAEYLRAFAGDRRVQAIQAALAERLLERFRHASAPAWPWFEDRLTYCNARLSQALLVTSEWLDSGELHDVGVRSLDWLLALQLTERDELSPIGSNGFYVRGGPRARFDQQPVEVAATVSACLDARRVTGDTKWAVRARRAFDWFLGWNDIQLPLYDAATGACHDGLHPDRVNANQGAESTVSFLTALLELRTFDRVAPRRPPVAPATSS